MLPRLAGSAKELSRQPAGIGTRRSGDRKLKPTDAAFADRVSKVTKSIESIRKQRSLRRQTRQAVAARRGCLVGYTNAGKSTLLTP